MCVGGGGGVHSHMGSTFNQIYCNCWYELPVILISVNCLTSAGSVYYLSTVKKRIRIARSLFLFFIKT